MNNTEVQITVYTKTGCPWRKNVLDFLHEYDLPYIEKNMTEHPEFIAECESFTGQSKCPTIKIDEHWIPDGDADQLKAYLGEIGLI